MYLHLYLIYKIMDAEVSRCSFHSCGLCFILQFGNFVCSRSWWKVKKEVFHQCL